MKYNVLVSFTDDADKAAPAGANVYWAGKSVYPRSRYTPAAERLKYLQGTDNRFRKPIIAARREAEATEATEAAEAGIRK